MPEFYMTFARKINKVPEFYMIFAPKIFSPEFVEGKCPLPPVSYAYGFTTAQMTLPTAQIIVHNCTLKCPDNRTISSADLQLPLHRPSKCNVVRKMVKSLDA